MSPRTGHASALVSKFGTPVARSTPLRAQSGSKSPAGVRQSLASPYESTTPDVLLVDFLDETDEIIREATGQSGRGQASPVPTKAAEPAQIQGPPTPSSPKAAAPRPRASSLKSIRSPAAASEPSLGQSETPQQPTPPPQASSAEQSTPLCIETELGSVSPCAPLFLLFFFVALCGKHTSGVDRLTGTIHLGIQ